MTVKPFSPSEAEAMHVTTIPDQIITAVNKRLVANAGSRCTILQDEIIAEAVEAGLDKRAIFDNHWLDFEKHFETFGWKVTYDKPGYNESYPASWEFSPAR